MIRGRIARSDGYMNQILWVTPLLLLPGVALLIMSTSARLTRLHDEMHHLMDHAGEARGDTAERLWTRAQLLQRALVLLYGAVGLLSTSSLVGGALALVELRGSVVVVGLTCGAVLGIVAAAVLLVLESRQLVEIFRDHYEILRQR